MLRRFTGIGVFMCFLAIASVAAAQDSVESLLSDLTQKYIYALIHEEKIDQGSTDNIDTFMLKSSAEEAEPIIAKLTAAKVPDSTVINGTDGQPSTTLGEMKKRIPAWKNKATHGKDAANQADEAKWAPFTTVLKGDRLAYFNRTYRGGCKVFSSGGKSLETPADFQKASVWYTYTFNRDSIPHTWEVTARKFKGDAFLGEPVVTNGEGDRPPTSEYK